MIERWAIWNEVVLSVGRSWVHVDRTADLQKASSEGVNNKDQPTVPSMVFLNISISFDRRTVSLQVQRFPPQHE